MAAEQPDEQPETPASDESVTTTNEADASEETPILQPDEVPKPGDLDSYWIIKNSSRVLYIK